ncbi:hypothetical protein ACGFT2_20680 [Streptomyces sp. NPDC048514]|uniref:hypothetical protein n=1 Tax=Streptomyces sp. NPDC048514 TaxID=3365564 RepID=UPI003718EE8E
MLSSGAVASVHYRGGISRGTNFHWEINGTDGDLVVTGDTGHLQLGEFAIEGAHGSGAELSRLTVPERYFDPELQELRGTPAYNIGAAYAQIRRDLTHGGSEVPDFAHGARHHRLLDRIERAAEHACPSARRLRHAAGIRGASGMAHAWTDTIPWASQKSPELLERSRPKETPKAAGAGDLHRWAWHRLDCCSCNRLQPRTRRRRTDCGRFPGPYKSPTVCGYV